MTIAIYPDIIAKQDLSPDQGFGQEIDDDCQAIHDACKGWGADNELVIAAIGKDATGRWKIAKRYPELYENKSLSELFKKEFSGDYGFAMRCLSMPLDEAECYMLKKATDGIGCKPNVIYSIVCGRTNDEINLIKKNYFKFYTKDLGRLLAGEMYGDSERLVLNCLQAGEEDFDPQFHTIDKATEDAEFLYEKGQGKFFGTDEKNIFKLLCSAPPEHVKNINRIYAEKYGYTLEKAMEKELSGNVKIGTLHLLGMKLKPFEAIAKLIKSACAGIGTDELLLTCCVVRYQSVMKDVMTAHIELFGKTVHDRVREETSGNYKEALLATLNAVWPEGGL